MAETQPNTPAQTSSGGQNTVVIILLAMLMLAAVFVMINMSNQDNSSQQTRLEELQKRIDAKEKELRAQGYDIPANTANLDMLADSISRDALTLKASAEKLQQTLSDKDRELSQTKSELEASIKINERHGAESVKLREQLAQLQSQQGQVTFLNQQINDLKSQLAQKNQQILALGSRPDGAELTEVQKDLNEALLKNKELQTKVSELTSLNNTMVSPSEVQSLKDQVARLNPENENLKLQVQELRAKLDRERLYVQSADQLLPAAAKLYRELEKLEDLNQEQLKEAYNRIGEQLNARIVKDVHFKTGMANVGFSDQADIKDRLAGVEPGSSILIVGYASKTGDADQNSELSAQRSATTASVVNHLLEEKNHVHAVYLGQTARFSESAENNQICEIWEIRK